MAHYQRLPNGFRKNYGGEYARRNYERWKGKQAAAEEDETIHAYLAAPVFFDIQGFLKNTGERNYCINLFCGEKGKLIQYLHERGAEEDQIAQVFKILADIIKE